MCKVPIQPLNCRVFVQFHVQFVCESRHKDYGVNKYALLSFEFF